MHDQHVDLARRWGYTASDAFRASAAYFQGLPDDAWSDPTGCEEWNELTLAAHIVGEAVWFPNLVRVVTRGDPAHPPALYEEMNTWPAERLCARLQEAAAELRDALDEAMPSHAQTNVDIGWTTVPLWQTTYVILMEGVYHDWDTRAGREPDATIPAAWAVLLAKGIDFSAPLVAHGDAVNGASGRYRLHVGDGVGPTTIVVEGGKLKVTPDHTDTPDLTLFLSADQCARLVAGRFALEAPVASGEVRAEGDLGRVAELNRIFGGIANG